MKNVLLTIEYFGPVSSYRAMYHADEITVEYFENYQKKSTRNRAQVLSPNGVVSLSVPLSSGKNSKCPIMEVEVNYDRDWVEEHCQALLSCYGKSPYYEYYISDIENILGKKHKLLYHLNNELTAYCKDALDIDTELLPTFTYERTVKSDTIDIRGLSFDKRSNLIGVPIPYRQVWNDRFDFTPDLSVLDLLFCHGPEAGYYL